MALSLLTDEAINKNSEHKEGVLIAYFSCSGATKRIATIINSLIGGNLIEIKPTKPYSNADLEYYDDASRCVKEHNNQNILPEISGEIKYIDQYNTIVIGYPLWWGEAPNIIHTFLKKYDFSNKNIITFSTSISTSKDSSKSRLINLAPNAKWNDSFQRFQSNVSEAEVKRWIEKLNLINNPSDSDKSIKKDL